MFVNNAFSVSHALSQGLHALRVGGVNQPSRVGDVRVIPHPVLTVYHNPLNRVLFSPTRDANPFFHVMESLWMLAGHNDLPWLAQFNKRMASYSDDGGATQPGAYGYRWRQYFGYDQLETIIVELKSNPQTRRCVLAMWDGGHEEYFEYAPMRGDLISAISGSADVPCNTHAYFDTIDGRLNMTVCNRSNDAWWGAHGANAVHFSFLLEYVAAMTGIPMGVYRQFSNNYHIYTNVVGEDRLMPLAREVDATDLYLVWDHARIVDFQVLRRVPLVTQGAEEFFLADLDDFMNERELSGHNTFFTEVAEPMRRAWLAHKAKQYDAALESAESIKAFDWRMACAEWLHRRKVKHETNTARFTEVCEPTATTEFLNDREAGSEGA